ncbi:MAG: lipoyl(octanoyl) transferase LipB [Candidatus Dasytiphilus stammeri]
MQYADFIIRYLGLQHWILVSNAMHHFNEKRNSNTPDELWLVEHFPIFTEGKAGKQHNNFIIIDDISIPVLKTDRGGKITYHGPGQLIMYIMIDLKRRKISVRQLLTVIQESVIDTLKHFHIESYVRPNAPGVYIDNNKICSLGLRIHNGCSLHGLALNIKMDLSPFGLIYPCGFPDLKMTQLSYFKHDITVLEVYPILIKNFLTHCHYNNH